MSCDHDIVFFTTGKVNDTPPQNYSTAREIRDTIVALLSVKCYGISYVSEILWILCLLVFNYFPALFVLYFYMSVCETAVSSAYVLSAPFYFFFVVLSSLFSIQNKSGYIYIWRASGVGFRRETVYENMMTFHRQ